MTRRREGKRKWRALGIGDGWGSEERESPRSGDRRVLKGCQDRLGWEGRRCLPGIDQGGVQKAFGTLPNWGGEGRRGIREDYSPARMPALPRWVVGGGGGRRNGIYGGKETFWICDCRLAIAELSEKEGVMNFVLLLPHQ